MKANYRKDGRTGVRIDVYAGDDDIVRLMVTHPGGTVIKDMTVRAAAELAGRLLAAAERIAPGSFKRGESGTPRGGG